MNSKLKAKIAAAPPTPGVYIMKDRAGNIIYIGKAKSLKKRLNSYLRSALMPKAAALMANVFDIELKLCPTEAMSLLFEANLIHKYKPKYNISLRDDKSFPLVKLTNEAYPALSVIRRKKYDGARYLGPYTSVKLLRQALKIIRRFFPYRSCKVLPKKPCVYFRLNLCFGPCIGKITRKGYAKIISSIFMILEGKIGALVQRLTGEMDKESKALNFEAAAKLRDRINALSAITSSQSGFSSYDALEDLRGLLKLNKIPKRIEAFDISNILGQEATGSMVSFFMAQPDKNNYRRFRVRTVEGVNDYAMLSEVVRRRYERLILGNKPLPDLILIDGGKQHLIAAAKELKNLNLKIPLASIAKEEEHIYVQDKAIPIKLQSDTPALNLIRKMRDEAHRFALKYHHLLRRKKIIGR